MVNINRQVDNELYDLNNLHFILYNINLHFIINLQYIFMTLTNT